MSIDTAKLNKIFTEQIAGPFQGFISKPDKWTTESVKELCNEVCMYFAGGVIDFADAEHDDIKTSKEYDRFRKAKTHVDKAIASIEKAQGKYPHRNLEAAKKSLELFRGVINTDSLIFDYPEYDWPIPKKKALQQNSWVKTRNLVNKNGFKF